MHIREKIEAVRDYAHWRDSSGASGVIDGTDLLAWERELRSTELVQTVKDSISLISAGQAELAVRTLDDAVSGLE